MRTRLDIDDRLLHAAKKRAAEKGETLTHLIEEALRLRAVDTTVLIYAYRENLRWACDSTVAAASSFSIGP